MLITFLQNTKGRREDFFIENIWWQKERGRKMIILTLTFCALVKISIFSGF